VIDDGTTTLLDDALIADIDTTVVISLDSFRTGQTASGAEIEAVRRFLSNPDHLIFVCPHHEKPRETCVHAAAGRIATIRASSSAHGVATPGTPKSITIAARGRQSRSSRPWA
jgi:hypothetical protein